MFNLATEVCSKTYFRLIHAIFLSLGSTTVAVPGLKNLKSGGGGGIRMQFFNLKVYPTNLCHLSWALFCRLLGF